jgi:hypothetical protein
MPTLTFKVSEDEARRIRTLARQRHLTISAYLRQQAKSEAVPPAAVRRVRCPHTGALVFAPQKGMTPLTTDSVREMLPDFP